MLDLCLDTSGGASVAIVEDGRVVATATEDDSRRHAESLAPLIEQARSAAGVTRPWDRVLVGTGPAPFTGLRAGLVTARVIALASGAQLHGAPSLAVLAAEEMIDGHSGADEQSGADEAVTAVVDARRGEVYWASYARSPRSDDHSQAGPAQAGFGLVEVSAPTVGKSATVRGRQVGPGRPVRPEFLPWVVDSMLAQGQATPTEPLYLREPDVHGK